MVKKKKQEGRGNVDIQAVAQEDTKAISGILRDFLVKTGQVIVSIDIETVGEPIGGQIAITQTVNVKYGVPQIQFGSQPARPIGSA